MIYMAYVSNTNHPKNQLQRAILDFLKKADRKIVPEDRVQQYITAFKNYINKLTKEHPRCTPIQAAVRDLSEIDLSEAKDIFIDFAEQKKDNEYSSSIGIVSFQLLASK